ncbi:MAG: phage holin family protein [Ardenticatenaceae bacterium]|nr:phage holin family protein [Ardenticatenaceae bacterium]
MRNWRKFIPLNWKAIRVSLVVNSITLAIIILLTPGIHLVNYRFGMLLLLSAGLGLLNTFVKPFYNYSPSVCSL